MESRSIGARLLRTKVFITNALKSEVVLARVAPFGYTREALLERLAFNKMVAEKRAAKVEALGEQLYTGELAAMAYAESRAAYDDIRAVALLIIKGPLVRFFGPLGLSDQPPRTTADYTLEAQMVYQVVLATPSLQAAFAAVGYGVEKFEQAHYLLDQYIALYGEHRKLIGETYIATDVQDAALKEHDAWFALFRQTTKFLLRDNPGLYDSLLLG